MTSTDASKRQDGFAVRTNVRLTGQRSAIRKPSIFALPRHLHSLIGNSTSTESRIVNRSAPHSSHILTTRGPFTYQWSHLTGSHSRKKIGLNAGVATSVRRAIGRLALNARLLTCGCAPPDSLRFVSRAWTRLTIRKMLGCVGRCGRSGLSSFTCWFRPRSPRPSLRLPLVTHDGYSCARNRVATICGRGVDRRWFTTTTNETEVIAMPRCQSDVRSRIDRSDCGAFAHSANMMCAP